MLCLVICLGLAPFRKNDVPAVSRHEKTIQQATLSKALSFPLKAVIKSRSCTFSWRFYKSISMHAGEGEELAVVSLTSV